MRPLLEQLASRGIHLPQTTANEGSTTLTAMGGTLSNISQKFATKEAAPSELTNGDNAASPLNHKRKASSPLQAIGDTSRCVAATVPGAARSLMGHLASRGIVPLAERARGAARWACDEGSTALRAAWSVTKPPIVQQRNTFEGMPGGVSASSSSTHACSRTQPHTFQNNGAISSVQPNSRTRGTPERQRRIPTQHPALVCENALARDGFKVATPASPRCQPTVGTDLVASLSSGNGAAASSRSPAANDARLSLSSRRQCKRSRSGVPDGQASTPKRQCIVAAIAPAATATAVNCKIADGLQVSSPRRQRVVSTNAPAIAAIELSGGIANGTGATTIAASESGGGIADGSGACNLECHGTVATTAAPIPATESSGSDAHRDKESGHSRQNLATTDASVTAATEPSRCVVDSDKESGYRCQNLATTAASVIAATEPSRCVVDGDRESSPKRHSLPATVATITAVTDSNGCVAHGDGESSPKRHSLSATIATITAVTDSNGCVAHGDKESIPRRQSLAATTATAIAVTGPNGYVADDDGESSPRRHSLAATATTVIAATDSIGCIANGDGESSPSCQNLVATNATTIAATKSSDYVADGIGESSPSCQNLVATSATTIAATESSDCVADGNGESSPRRQNLDATTVTATGATGATGSSGCIANGSGESSPRFQKLMATNATTTAATGSTGCVVDGNGESSPKHESLVATTVTTPPATGSSSCIADGNRESSPKHESLVATIVTTAAATGSSSCVADGNRESSPKHESLVATTATTTAATGSSGCVADGNRASRTRLSIMARNPLEEMCAICCDGFSSGSVVRLPCQHGWYCAQCILRHTEARLEVGAVHVPCPECNTPIPERDLRSLLPGDVIDRLLARSLEQAVATTSDLYSCPTPDCPMRVAIEEGETARLKCPMCRKTCCLRCSTQPYHRGLTCEQHAEKVRTRGRNTEEAGILKWMQETGSKQCPTCRMAVTKQNIDNQNTQRSECHKMLCRNCSTRFCFKCLAVLTTSYTCGCTRNEHGFIDPRTGKRVNHLPSRRPAGRGAKGRGRAGGRGRG